MYVQGANPPLTNLDVHDCNTGLRLHETQADVNGLVAHGNLSQGVYVYNNTGSSTNNQFTQCLVYGFHLSFADNLSFEPAAGYDGPLVIVVVAPTTPDDPGGGGCATVPSEGGLPVTVAFLVLFMAVALRMRRAPH